MCQVVENLQNLGFLFCWKVRIHEISFSNDKHTYPGTLLSGLAQIFSLLKRLKDGVFGLFVFGEGLWSNNLCVWGILNVLKDYRENILQEIVCFVFENVIFYLFDF